MSETAEETIYSLILRDICQEVVINVFLIILS